MATEEPDTACRPRTEAPPVFQQMEDYPWDSDPEFQSGLHAILGSDSSPEQAKNLTLRARCFYFSRKNNMPIDFNDYQTWHAQQRPNGTASTTAAPPGPLASDGSFPDLLNYRMALNSSTDPAEPPAPYPTSFSEIVELITKGDPIPGIKEVPDIILDGQASHATTAKRRKPWENRVSNGVSIPSDTC